MFLKQSKNNSQKKKKKKKKKKEKKKERKEKKGGRGGLKRGKATVNLLPVSSFLTCTGGSTAISSSRRNFGLL